MKADGSAPGEDEVESILAATPELDEVLLGTLLTDSVTRSVSGYRIGGLRPGVRYRILLLGRDGRPKLPADQSFVVMTSSLQARSLDLVLRSPKPFALAKSRRSGSSFPAG